MKPPYTAPLAFLALSLLPGCPAPKEEGLAAKREAERIWQTRCAYCHGSFGAGDGPGSVGLDPKPRSFQNPSWQAGVDDARIKAVIVGGGASVGLSPNMAPNPDLDGKVAVLDALVLKIRRLQK